MGNHVPTDFKDYVHPKHAHGYLHCLIHYHQNQKQPKYSSIGEWIKCGTSI